MQQPTHQPANRIHYDQHHMEQTLPGMASNRTPGLQINQSNPINHHGSAHSPDGPLMTVSARASTPHKQQNTKRSARSSSPRVWWRCCRQRLMHRMLLASPWPGYVCCATSGLSSSQRLVWLPPTCHGGGGGDCCSQFRKLSMINHQTNDKKSQASSHANIHKHTRCFDQL